MGAFTNQIAGRVIGTTNRLPVLVDSEGRLIVSELRKYVVASVAHGTAAYAAGDIVGSVGAAGIFEDSALFGRVENLVVVDRADQKAALNLILFEANPAVAAADNAAFAFGTGDEDLVLAVIPIAEADYVTVGGVAVATLKNLQVPIRAASSADNKLYYALVTTGTPTYTAGALDFRLGVIVDGGETVLGSVGN